MQKLRILLVGISFLLGALCWYPNTIPAQTQSGNILAEHAEFSFHAKINDSECKPLIAKNETATNIVIEKISLAASSQFFVLTDIAKLPMKLAPGESVSLGYTCFRPKNEEKEYNSTVKVVFSPMLQKDDGIIQLHAKSFAEPTVASILPTSTGAIISFDPLSIRNGTLLSMVGKDEEFFRSFTFKNVSSKTITVNSLDFEKNDGRFDVSSIEPGGGLPIDVAPGESFSVRIAYHSFSRVPALNKLLIYTDDSKDPVRYDIRGLQMPLSQMDWNKHSESAQSK